MSREQHKNTINNRQGNILPPEFSYLTLVSPEFSNTDETQNITLKPTL